MVNKKIILISIFMFIMLVSSVSAVLTTDLSEYWTLDDTLTGSLKLYNGTKSGAYYSSGKINNGLLFDGTDDYMTSSVPSSLATTYTINLWFNINSTATSQFLFSGNDGSTGDSMYPDIYYDSSVNDIKFGVASSDPRVFTKGTFSSGTWYMITAVLLANDTKYIYVNGVLNNSHTWVGTQVFANSIKLGARGTSSSYDYTGKIDEVGIWGRALNSTEIMTLYNGAVGLQYPFLSNFTITTNLNDYDIIMVSNETKTYNSTSSTTYITDLDLSDTRLWNITISANNYDTQTFINYNISVNGSLSLTLIPSTKVNVYANQIMTNDSITNFYVGLEKNVFTATQYSATSTSYVLKRTWNSTELLSNYSYIFVTNITSEFKSLSGDTGWTYYKFYYNDSTTADSNIETGTSITTYEERTYINPNPTKAITKIELYMKESGGTSYTQNNNITYYDSFSNNDNPTYWLDDVGVSNFGFFKDTYYYSIQSQNITYRTTNNLYFTNVYQNIFNVTLKDIVTNATINEAGSFQFTYDGTNYIYNITNGTTSFYTIYGNHTDIITTTTNYYTHYPNDVYVNTSTNNETYYLYRDRSLWIYAKDLISGVDLSNFSANVYNVLTLYNGSTTGTNIKINNITAGNYIVRVDKTGYQPSDYFITVENKSHQVLQAYLTNTSDTLTYTLKDEYGLFLLPDVTSSIYYLIGSTWTLINSKNTDITGRVQFGIDNDFPYKFVFTKTNYDTKTFFLQPLFTDYTILLTPSSSSTPDVNTGDWYVVIDPYFVYNNQLNNVTFNIFSGTGSLEYYDVSITTPTNTTTYHYTNTYGGSNIYSVNITGAEILETLNITYSVKEVGEVLKEFTVLIPIQGTDTNEENTLYGFSSSMSEYGYFEKSIIGTLLLLILLGVVATITTMSGGNTFVITGVSLLVFSGIFTFIGFFPTWTYYIIVIAFIMMLIAKLKGE